MKAKKIFLTYLPLGIAVALAGFVIGLVVMDMVVMPLVVGKHRGHSIVPVITNMSLHEARKIIKDAALKMEKSGEEYSDVIPDGYICNQKVKPGKEVKKGRTVYYTVSKGSEIVSMPILKGKTLRQARLTLKSLGLKIGNAKYVFDDSMPVDYVLYSKPDAKSHVVRETKVEVTVSQGAEPVESFVPNLVGMPLQKAIRSIRKAALSVGTVSDKVKKELLPKTVISQSLSPGSTVKRGTVINLIISVYE